MQHGRFSPETALLLMEFGVAFFQAIAIYCFDSPFQNVTFAPRIQ